MRRLSTVLFGLLFTLFLSSQTFSQNLSVIQNQKAGGSPNSTEALVTINYDGANAGNSVGDGGTTFIGGARFTPAIMGPLTGGELQFVQFYYSQAATGLTIKVYDAGTATDPGALLVDQPLNLATLMVDGWNEVELSTYVPISGNDLWICLEVEDATTTAFPFGVDAGPADPNGDFVNDSGVWQHLAGFGLNFNWNIRGVVEDSPVVPPIFFDDFDSYTAGQQLTGQTVEWTTWSGTPGTGEDPFVSSNYSYSGSNSTVIISNNDVVRLHGSKTTGKWYMSFAFYIPATKSGYYNTMNGFAPNPNVWGMDAYFDVGGAGRLDTTGGGGAPATSVAFSWTVGAWNQAIVIVDLDSPNHPAEFWIGTSPANLTQIAVWDFTQAGTKPIRLDCNDFFGAATTDEMYIDDYYFSDALPPILPVELSSFTANVSQGNVVLNWSTATEINNQGFEVQKRTTEGQFATIGHVQGNGTTTEIKNYSFTDAGVVLGTYYYRLKQVDFNGDFEFSNEIFVDVNAPLEFALAQNYPNPFNPTTSINFSIAEPTFVKLAIYNLLGEEVQVLKNDYMEAGTFKINFDASSLPSGMYLYKIETAQYSSVKKMMLMK